MYRFCILHPNNLTVKEYVHILHVSPLNHAG